MCNAIRAEGPHVMHKPITLTVSLRAVIQRCSYSSLSWFRQLTPCLGKRPTVLYQLPRHLATNKNGSVFASDQPTERLA